MVNVLVCVKRVPGASGRILLSADGMSVDTRHVGYTTSPHEECAVEAAVQLVTEHGGAATVLTLGPDDAVEQLRDALAIGVTAAIHLNTGDEGSADGHGPSDVAAAIAAVAGEKAAAGEGFDLILLGNDAADTGDFQVGVRLAYLLGRPVVTGVRSLSLLGGTVSAVADGPDGVEEYELPLPAVLTVKEGEISPRYPSIPGRLKAKKVPVDTRPAPAAADGTARQVLLLPPEQEGSVQILGTGPQAAAALVDALEQLGVVSR
jgi:electron transfer flavoprotein beta subunit